MKNELKNNYKCIIKENDYIMFVKWSSLDSSCGIVYCREPQNMNNMFNNGEKDIIKLSKPNWYYFKHIGD